MHFSLLMLIDLGMEHNLLLLTYMHNTPANTHTYNVGKISIRELMYNPILREFNDIRHMNNNSPQSDNRDDLDNDRNGDNNNQDNNVDININVSVSAGLEPDTGEWFTSRAALKVYGMYVYMLNV